MFGNMFDEAMRVKFWKPIDNLLHLNRSDLACRSGRMPIGYPINRQMAETVPFGARTDDCNLTHRLRMKGSPASKFMNKGTFRGLAKMPIEVIKSVGLGLLTVWAKQKAGVVDRTA